MRGASFGSPYRDVYKRQVLELVQKLDDDMMIDAESGEKLANRLSSYEDKLPPVATAKHGDMRYIRYSSLIRPTRTRTGPSKASTLK